MCLLNFASPVYPNRSVMTSCAVLWHLRCHTWVIELSATGGPCSLRVFPAAIRYSSFNPAFCAAPVALDALTCPNLLLRSVPPGARPAHDGQSLCTSDGRVFVHATTLVAAVLLPLWHMYAWSRLSLRRRWENLGAKAKGCVPSWLA